MTLTTTDKVQTLDGTQMERQWRSLMGQLADVLKTKNAHAARTVVLLPYAQLMQQARSAWAAYAQIHQGATAFVPRFETTMNWASATPGFAVSPDDIRMDAAVDALTAASLLRRAGLARQQNQLSGRLVEAAWSIARLAAAQPPGQRLAWGALKAQELGDLGSLRNFDDGMASPALAMEPTSKPASKPALKPTSKPASKPTSKPTSGPTLELTSALALELAVARIALAWAAASGYPSDVLFNADHTALDLLVVLDGFQAEPLTEALKQHFGDRTARLTFDMPSSQGVLALHTAQDLEDEAHLAAACVLAHLAAGRSPVALVAQDRLLTRRVSSLLASKSIALRDETGWKLSTTRAAATLMGLLQALPWEASTDAVLDWLKNAPAFAAADVARAETALRRIGIRFWRAIPASWNSSDSSDSSDSLAAPVAAASSISSYSLSTSPSPSSSSSAATQPELQAVAGRVNALRAALQSARPLADWLKALQAALELSGQWSGLTQDVAGMGVIAALHVADASALPANPRLSLQDFTQWARQTLEAASFAPPHPAVAQVVILPLSQLLGRPMQAVVLPGCDDIRLQVCPEPPGQWTSSQRALLGLPTRAELASAQRAAWQYALSSPHLDLLWRLSEGGESLMPSGFVQQLLLTQPLGLSPDMRPLRLLAAQPTARPGPQGHALPVTQLSASAYEDLRRCPYRFFALRLLKLQEADELQNELGKRDFGNWLHLLLHSFQNALKNVSNQPLDQQMRARVAMINIAAEEATKLLGLSAEEFLPFAAIWPRVRAGYLDWLAMHEASGARYVEGEVWKRMPLGSVELVGKIDRIDQMPDGSRLVMDYKTEPGSTTKDRVKDAGEDTQLAFYAALLDDDTLAAAYVNLGEKEPTKTYAQPDIVPLRDELIGGIVSDMARMAGGAKLPALGEGKACDYCAARGLCRKDFWN